MSENNIMRIDNFGCHITSHGEQTNSLSRNLFSLKEKNIGLLITEKNLSLYKSPILPIIVNNKIGFINKQAEIIITPQYDSVNMDYNEAHPIIIVEKDELFGTINDKGENIIPFKYKYINPFKCGRAMVKNTEGKYAYIDALDKQITYFGQYSWCDPEFVSGFARVEKDGKKGIIDINGRIILSFKYDKIWSLKKEYLSSIKAYIGEEIKTFNLESLVIQPDDSPATKASKKLRRCQTFPIDLYKRRKFNPNSSYKYKEDWDDDPFGDIKDYNNGFSQEDVESGLADAFENDISALWNID